MRLLLPVLLTLAFFQLDAQFIPKVRPAAGEALPAWAEAMYADEDYLYVFDGAGQPLLNVPRSSGTLIEYPTVADVDNDGSAEIVVTSNVSWKNMQTAPLVQVVRDKEDRWIQARRIWNQHTYHVTNVREDGTIPQFEKPHWQALNTFRTQAQISAGGGVCQPPRRGDPRTRRGPGCARTPRPRTTRDRRPRR